MAGEDVMSIAARLLSRAKAEQELEETGKAGLLKRYTGSVHDEDDLVIKIGDSLEESEETYPLTAAYRYLQGFRGQDVRLTLHVEVEMLDQDNG